MTKILVPFRKSMFLHFILLSSFLICITCWQSLRRSSSFVLGFPNRCCKLSLESPLFQSISTKITGYLPKIVYQFGLFCLGACHLPLTLRTTTKYCFKLLKISMISLTSLVILDSLSCIFNVRTTKCVLISLFSMYYRHHYVF